jgi:protein-L-isoaspartate(D-aspartate) O-methyltransferase
VKREPDSPDEDARARERELMVRQQILERGIDTPRVLEAFLRVPRHFFVPPEYVKQAYDDRPLYIGHGQTISQPYMVGLMTDALELKGDEKVLDIGTGSGYQAAILAELAREVHTVERIEELALGANGLLEDLGYDNVTFHVADGTLGWTDAAPFDAILVAAAAPGVPETLKEQLATGGRLVIPVGPPYSQTLRLVTRTSRGFESRDICPCIFVKLIGAEGYAD